MLELRNHKQIAKSRGDRGEGAVSYIAVIILIAAILGAISVTDIGKTIQDGIKSSVQKVVDAKPGGGAPAAP